MLPNNRAYFRFRWQLIARQIVVFVIHDEIVKSTAKNFSLRFHNK